MAGWRKRAVELEERKRESTLKFHEGFSPDTDQRGEWRENSKVDRKRESSEKGVNFSPKIFPPHTHISPSPHHHWANLLFIMWTGQNKTGDLPNLPDLREKSILSISTRFSNPGLHIMTSTQKECMRNNTRTDSYSKFSLGYATNSLKLTENSCEKPLSAQTS